MERRQCLTGVGGLLATALGGCLDEGAGDAELRVGCSDATLEPDERVTLTAHARNVDRLSFSPPSAAPLDVVSVDVSPSPDVQEDSFPPIWHWDAPRSPVEAEMEVYAPGDARGGTYSYGITGSRRDEHRTEQCRITIRNGSN